MAGHSFIRNKKGTVAVIFGLVLIPVLGFTGLALDYSRASNVQMRLQAALDATGLAVAREARRNDQEELLAIANNYFNANYANTFASDYHLTDVERDETSIVVAASGNVPTSILGIIGIHNVPVAAQARVAWRSEKVEVALVLDNTGSMSQQNRIGKLKTASRKLLERLQDQVIDPDDVRISIVPFDMHVRVENQYAEASWLRPLNQQGPGQQGQSNASGQGQASAQWQGCIEDRNHPYDVVTTPAGSTETLYPAVKCNSNSLLRIQPLTNDFERLDQIIGNMQPAGWTNITIGLMWGLHTLLPQEPFTNARPLGEENLKKIIVLMTDGENTKNRWNESSAQINVRTRMACDSTKATGIMLYTVRFMEGDQAMLRDCASSPDMFFDVQSLDQLDAAFEAIAAQISRLRLTH